MKRAMLWLSTASLLAACGADERELGQATEDIRRYDVSALDLRRSLAVTDVEILERFSLQRVMDQLARGARGMSGIALFQQWWDTQNPAQGLGRGPHCDDEIDAQGKPLLNGYPYDCRPGPSEGAQAACSSFTDPACAYIPIGLFNRFDLAPEDGAHCGEHRIVYAKQTGQTEPRNRNLVIFEAVLPNPSPREGLQGCRGIVEAWAELSWIDAPRRRAERLERMYFQGVGRFPPIVSPENLGANERYLGQIRTNQFMIEGPPFIWTLREFKLVRECRRKNCQLWFAPEPVKNNPPAVLFGDPAADPRVARFQALLLRDNVAALAATTLTDIAMTTPDEFNSGQSHSSGSTEMDYGAALGTQAMGLRQAIWRALGTVGSDLTPEQLVARARTQTCAGCHQLSNNEQLGGGLVWPPSLGFVHVTEVMPEEVAGSLRYRISPLLTSTFLPLRARIMSDFLQTRPCRRRGAGWSVGGRFTH